MNATEFARKWERNTTNERAAAQSHFNDLCELLGHAKPAEADPTGQWFAFEYGVEKRGGGKRGQGWADVWKKDFFGWEYKGKHKNLDAAHDQLKQYQSSLLNPQILVVCDIERIIVHTHFPNTPSLAHEITLVDLQTARGIEVLRKVFFDVEALRPQQTVEAITKIAAQRLGAVADTMKQRGLDRMEIARYLDRIVFCLFAEDVNLLPRNLFSDLLKDNLFNAPRASKLIGDLFDKMNGGGDFGRERIAHFNGNLFSGAPHLELAQSELDAVREAALLDWKDVDASIFGTIFERVLQTDVRSALGAHYTNRADIEALIDPVLIAPLQSEWEKVRLSSGVLFDDGKSLEARAALQTFADRLSAIGVLDPACGSGNFLYVSLQKLLDLEKSVAAFAGERDCEIVRGIGPQNFQGIEVNPFAFELAQTTLWIGYLQWLRNNGEKFPDEPILRASGHFRHADAILDLSGEEPCETIWPQAEFIVGNPPFLGGKKLRRKSDAGYVDKLLKTYEGRVPAEADLCCYWFEKARAHIENGRARRAGLVATQAIRGGANRGVLKRIKESGDIFFAVSDRDWTLDGANVHISLVGFDDGTQSEKTLDGQSVAAIHSNLTASADVTQAKPLRENLGIGFMGDTKGGVFEMKESAALAMMQEPNVHGVPNSEVLVPWVNGSDMTGTARRMWIVDFGTGKSETDIALFQKPYEHIKANVWPKRQTNNRETYRKFWWQHVEARPAMMKAIRELPRFLVTPTVSKHRIFAWKEGPTLPDHQLIVFARDDDYFFGVLHSRLHEVWALKLGTQLEDRPRYTPTSCFETFPFPVASESQTTAIGEAARQLNEFRQNHLLPPQWTREEILEFPASVGGAWSRYVAPESVENGIGLARYPRRVARDAVLAMNLAGRTLTNLYNERPSWLANAHRALDEAVFAAYGWNPQMSDDEILAALLELNGERANAQKL